MSHNRVYYALFLFFFVAIAILIIVFQLQKDPLAKITTYTQCKAAGYQITTNDLNICTLPNGKFFVEQFVPEPKPKSAR